MSLLNGWKAYDLYHVSLHISSPNIPVRLVFEQSAQEFP